MKNIFGKVIIFIVTIMLLMSPSLEVFAQQPPFDVRAKAALLMDYDTGTILYQKNIHEKLPMASITKIMTLILAFEAIEDGRISLDENVTISEYASSMGGSQVYLDTGEKIPVSALLKAIIVASGNDASVAIAEKIYGTHEVFVDKMNQKAQQLGMTNTHFANCTGFTADNHYTTAYDISIMSRELLKYPLFFKWSTIWSDNLVECKNNTSLTNTNRLVRFYDGCDGIKTGSTDAALYCVSATAKKGNFRLISIILAAPTGAVRFSEASKLLDYGFANYESLPIVKKGQVLQTEITVTGGKETKINGIAADDFSILQKKDQSRDFQSKVEIDISLKAPIEINKKIGTLTIEKDGSIVGTIDIVSDRQIQKANIYDYFTRIFNQWFKRNKEK